MRALHAPDPPADAFPLVEDRSACKECFFRELCPAVSEVPAHKKNEARAGG